MAEGLEQNGKDNVGGIPFTFAADRGENYRVDIVGYLTKDGGPEKGEEAEIEGLDSRTDLAVNSLKSVGIAAKGVNGEIEINLRNGVNGSLNDVFGPVVAEILAPYAKALKEAGIERLEAWLTIV